MRHCAGRLLENPHMFNLDQYRHEWFGNIRGDALSGLVVALALIPEAIAFSIIAGVNPGQASTL